MAAAGDCHLDDYFLCLGSTFIHIVRRWGSVLLYTLFTHFILARHTATVLGLGLSGQGSASIDLYRRKIELHIARFDTIFNIHDHRRQIATLEAFSSQVSTRLLTNIWEPIPVRTRSAVASRYACIYRGRPVPTPSHFESSLVYVPTRGPQLSWPGARCRWFQVLPAVGNLRCLGACPPPPRGWHCGKSHLITFTHTVPVNKSAAHTTRVH